MNSKSKDRSRQRLRENVYAGKVEKPSVCSMCGKKFDRKYLHGHHGNGYEDWANVEWLCLWCHRKVDADKMNRPEDSSLHRLTWNEVRQIRAEAKTGLSRRQLAQLHGVSKRHIFRLLSQDEWRERNVG